MTPTRKHELALANVLVAWLALLPTNPASAAGRLVPQVRTKAIKVGNPTLERWPLTDPDNALARSVWDMHLFGGRIYIGSGDFGGNKGPVDIWSLGPDGFLKEYTAPDEQVDKFCEADGKLVVPGTDPKEDWSLGNLYVKDPARAQNHGWEKLRTIPGALHVYDFTSFEGKWYVVTSTASSEIALWQSADQGKTWQALRQTGMQMLNFGGFLLMVRGDVGIRFDGKNGKNVAVRLFPQSKGVHLPLHWELFQGGVVYSGGGRADSLWTPQPLFFLRATEVRPGGAGVLVERFKAESVRDILVRGKTCYVMTAAQVKADAEDYRTRIYSAESIQAWALAAEFVVPGLPYSFEFDGKHFYVGLGARSYPGPGRKLVGPEAGSIWRIE